MDYFTIQDQTVLRQNAMPPLLMDGSWHSYRYDDIYESMGYEVLFSETTGSYQGDIHYLFFDPYTERFAYDCTGYGSCSGCDALEACDTQKELEELRESYDDSIRWFDTPGELYDWFQSHDWESDWSYSDLEETKFIPDAMAYLAYVSGS